MFKTQLEVGGVIPLILVQAREEALKSCEGPNVRNSCPRPYDANLPRPGGTETT